MTRQADTAKKPALLEKIVDHLIDQPLSTITFRGLAEAVGVSSFTLVYHFGTREQLVRDIIESIATRQRGFESVLDPETVTLESYLAGLRRTFDLTLLPRNRALQRLEFEAQMIEVLSPDRAITSEAHERLHSRERDTLVALGVEPDEAAIEAQFLIDTFYGIQVGLVVSNNVERTTAAFERALENHASQLGRLLAGTSS